jgi:hypothetical protein
MPLLVLSVLPLLLAACLYHEKTRMTPWLNTHMLVIAIFSVLNAMGATVDLVSVCVEWRNIPTGATVQGSGEVLYYQERNKTA